MSDDETYGAGRWTRSRNTRIHPAAQVETYRYGLLVVYLRPCGALVVALLGQDGMSRRGHRRRRSR